MLSDENRPNIRKVAKKSSDRLKVPKHSKKTKEQIEKTSIIEKAKWELTIMELQEKMFETPVTIEYMKYISKYFQPAHYEEVVLERKSLNICGYPLCSKKTQQLKGKYRLSSSKKKIFDITELKSYCGSDCMISSRYFASQLLDEPIYLRNLEKTKEADVIPLGVNIENWISKENDKLNTFTERSIDIYVKSMMKSLPNLNQNLVIHEHFENNKNNSNAIQPIIEKSSFQYDSIEGFQYKPQNTDQMNNRKPSTIILDKEILSSNISLNLSNKENRTNKNSQKKNNKEKIVSSVIMNKEDADKFNELYEQYSRNQKKEKELAEKKLLNDKNKTERNEITDNVKEITDNLHNLDINGKNEKILDENSNSKDEKLSRKKSVGILKKSNSVSKENLKVRFNEDPSIKIIETKEEMNKAYHASSRKRNNNKKKGKNGDVFYSYDVIEKSSVKKEVKESNAEIQKTENLEKNNDLIKENKEIVNTENKDSKENDPEKKIKTLFEMNKDLEKIIKITEMTKEEAKKKQKKKLVPNLSLFGKIWTNISSMITKETKLFLNNKIDEDELNELLLVDDEIMNTRKDILITNIMKSYSSIKLEHEIVLSIEDELILLIKSLIVSETMVVLSSVEYWILTVVFLKALTKRIKIIEEEITEEKWNQMMEAVDIPSYQLNEFVNLFN
ncbi:hypothetical protein BCR36DRAFT_328330 [Piromyces finnis]|uniref:RNA polymerase II subunit B1 CTD phosphatase RPAP2 homolog n=1 Tax=Piromyces finnis TaxID=1754191 RepID=A0A1Y1V7N7_9FUNG|nr:hypothetical protein BCR36DRAFT_328330 [Piromyces finnis]|eukprot:ORX49277.1 hypothetical protein BCR36DRAFT_328330 [Piromyces finnis]